MDDDKKELRQRYSELTTADLVELLRGALLPPEEAAIVDEMLEFRGVSKAVREKLKNAPASAPRAPVAVMHATSKDFASRPVLVSLIALFAVWRFISNLFSVFDSKSALSIAYFLGLAVLSILLAYGLWELKPWARKFMIFYCCLVVFLSWFLIVVLFLFADSSWRLSIDELAHAGPRLGGKAFVQAAVHKVLFIYACVWSVVYGLLMAYFFKADIRRLFA